MTMDEAADAYVWSLGIQYHGDHLAMRAKDTPTFTPDKCPSCLGWPKTTYGTRVRRAFIAGWNEREKVT